METQDEYNKMTRNPAEIRDRSGRALGGLFIVVIGAIFLARQMGVEFPHWFFSWKMILIAVGLFVGFRHKFRDWGWIVPVIVGLVFLADEFVEGVSFGHLIWPVAIIAAGLFMIFKPKRHTAAWQNTSVPATTTARTTENFFDTVNIFGGSKKVIISKDFRGGEITTIFGGSEINLTQADINGRAELELVQIFGGTKLIVPAHWAVSTEELVCIFGGVDDKRNPSTLTDDTTKVLIIKGTCIFGGLDIRTF